MGVEVDVYCNVLTVVNMHVLSLTAPQHPKKAVMKTIEPTMMDSVGAIPISEGSAFIPSLKLILYMTPIIISANPASCKKKLSLDKCQSYVIELNEYLHKLIYYS